jgi:hypothetical protein
VWVQSVFRASVRFALTLNVLATASARTLRHSLNLTIEYLNTRIRSISKYGRARQIVGMSEGVCTFLASNESGGSSTWIHP